MQQLTMRFRRSRTLRHQEAIAHRRAGNLARAAIKRGELVRGPCVVCGTTVGVQARRIITKATTIHCGCNGSARRIIAKRMGNAPSHCRVLAIRVRAHSEALRFVMCVRGRSDPGSKCCASYSEATPDATRVTK